MISTGTDAGSPELEDRDMDTEYCPECNSYLGIDEWDSCPECGALFVDDDDDESYDELEG